MKCKNKNHSYKFELFYNTKTLPGDTHTHTHMQMGTNTHTGICTLYTTDNPLTQVTNWGWQQAEQTNPHTTSNNGKTTDLLAFHHSPADREASNLKVFLRKERSSR